MEPILKITNLGKTYQSGGKSLIVLNDINFSVTHDLELASKMQRILRLRAGILTADLQTNPHRQ